MKNLNEEKYYPLNDVWYCTYEKDGQIECVPAFFEHDDVVIDLRDEKQIILGRCNQNTGITFDNSGNKIVPERKQFHISPRGFFRDYVDFKKVPRGQNLSIVICAADIFQNARELPRETILKYMDVAKDTYRSIPPKLANQEPKFVNFK